MTLVCVFFFFFVNYTYTVPAYKDRGVDSKKDLYLNNKIVNMVINLFDLSFSAVQSLPPKLFVRDDVPVLPKLHLLRQSKLEMNVPLHRNLYIKRLSLYQLRMIYFSERNDTPASSVFFALNIPEIYD